MPGMKHAARAAERYLRANPNATPYEIASATGCSARTARRVARRVREAMLVEWLNADPARKRFSEDMESAVMFGDFDEGERAAVERGREEIARGDCVWWNDLRIEVAGADIFPTLPKRKRIAVLSDLHCGSLVGLTPPAWHTGDELQRDMWQWYQREMVDLGPVDACFVLGDAIDGKGNRSGGVEQITTDLITQTDMATAALRHVQAKDFVFVHGTPYHVGADGEDMERLIARALGARIGGHEWISVNGCVFDLKHKVGGSGVPHGRHTAVARERLWNQLWHMRELAPKANVILRGHVHYHSFCGGPGWLAMTLPALQGPGSHYGVRQCSGIVDFGFVVFDVEQDGSYSWRVHEYKASIAEPKAVCL